MAERYEKERIPKKAALNLPGTVASYARKKIGNKKKEHFMIVCLDSRNRVIKDASVSVGTLNASLVHPREAFSEAINANAASVIFAHNHPSGDPEPSEDDLAITKRLTEAGKLLGIEVLDHIIVTKSGFLSFKEKGLL